jgi:hypothetical protein
VTKVGGLDDTIWIRPHSAGRGQQPRSRTNRLSLGILLVVIAVGVTAAIVAFFSAKDYGTPAFWTLPKHINYCGREYLDQGAKAGNPAVVKGQNSAGGAKWTFLSWTFSGRSIYAVVAPLHPPADAVCTMHLYIPSSGSQWETYVLSGGP